MTEVRCGNCGGTVLHEAGARPEGSPPSCPRCGSTVEVISESSQLAAGGSQAPGLYRTGIISLKAELSRSVRDHARAATPAPDVDVKVQGYLSIEGAQPDRADHRLRGEATVIGREEGEIVVPDPALSSRHFQVEEHDSEFFVRDLGSSNGTFVNGARVEIAKLQSGDRIHAGSTVFAFSVRHVIPM